MVTDFNCGFCCVSNFRAGSFGDSSDADGVPCGRSGDGAGSDGRESGSNSGCAAVVTELPVGVACRSTCVCGSIGGSSDAGGVRCGRSCRTVGSDSGCDAGMVSRYMLPWSVEGLQFVVEELHWSELHSQAVESLWNRFHVALVAVHVCVGRCGIAATLRFPPFGLTSRAISHLFLLQI